MSFGDNNTVSSYISLVGNQDTGLQMWGCKPGKSTLLWWKDKNTVVRNRRIFLFFYFSVYFVDMWYRPTPMQNVPTFSLSWKMAFSMAKCKESLLMKTVCNCKEIFSNMHINLSSIKMLLQAIMCCLVSFFGEQIFIHNENTHLSHCC